MDELEELRGIPRGRGLGYIPGDYEPGLRPLLGDSEPGTSLMPGNYRRMAGSKIKGLAQIDPALFAMLFP
jgi:hypothetical protein